MSGKAHPPELKKFMDKRVHLKINGNRAVEGILRGFDPFMNLVLDETIEFTKDGSRLVHSNYNLSPTFSSLYSTCGFETGLSSNEYVSVRFFQIKTKLID